MGDCLAQPTLCHQKGAIPHDGVQVHVRVLQVGGDAAREPSVAALEQKLGVHAREHRRQQLRQQQQPRTHACAQARARGELVRLLAHAAESDEHDAQPLVAAQPLREQHLVQHARHHDARLHEHVVRARVKGRQVYVDEVVVHAIEERGHGILEQQRHRVARRLHHLRQAAVVCHVKGRRHDELDELGEQHD